MDAFLEVLTVLGSTICHQLPERSYFLGDSQMPLCARCVGIHFGFFISTVFLFTGSRRFAGGLPSVKQAAILAAIMGFFLLDAGLSYSGLSESDNLRRTLSGLALGVSFPFVVFPFVNSILYPGRNPTYPLTRKLDYVLFGVTYLVGASAILASESIGAVFYAVSSVGVFGLFLFFSSVFFLVIVLGFEEWRARTWQKAMLAVVIAMVFLGAMAVLQDFLLDTT
jgi:uncharacterized membrane protein